jgi:23S rRNA pseudouridine1911/1915/1917 synthase
VFRVGPKDRGKRLDRFLGERIPGLSRTRIQSAIRERVSLSWAASARPSVPVRPGGIVRIATVVPVEEPLGLAIPILDRGPGWIAVDKPTGIPVHPVNRVRQNTLIRMLRRQEGDDGLRLVHRLDRETTGVLLVARDADTARLLSIAFARGRVTKLYAALVEGEVAADGGTIDLPVGRDPGARVWVRQAAGVGSPARTEWEVARRLAGRTLLRVRPHTGRRHQIRVHLAAIGHPVLGDILYGRPESDYLDLVRGAGDARRREGGPARQLLHCARLAFTDSCGPRTVTAPLPADFGLDRDEL